MTSSTTGRGRTLAVVGLVAAVLAIALVASAGPGTRAGLWGFRTGLGFFSWATFASLGAVAAGLVSLVQGGARGWATGALVLAVLAAIVPIGLRLRARAVPFIHDITTDTDTPPQFVAVLARRGAGTNPTAYGGPEVAAAQHRAYPDIAGLVLAEPPMRALERAESAARQLGWEIVAVVPAEGRLEATDTTRWFGFKDDVVVRVRPEGTGSRVDVRSLSRVGRSDLGKNAERIRSFLAILRG